MRGIRTVAVLARESKMKKLIARRPRSRFALRHSRFRAGHAQRRGCGRVTCRSFRAPRCSAIPKRRRPAYRPTASTSRSSRRATACSTSGSPSAASSTPAKPVTNDQKRGIRQHFWAFDNKHVLFLQDEGGDENWHVYAVDVVSGDAERPDAAQGRARRASSTCRGRSPASSPSASTIAMPEFHDLYEIEHRHRQAHAGRDRTTRSSPATTSTST